MCIALITKIKEVTKLTQQGPKLAGTTLFRYARRVGTLKGYISDFSDYLQCLICALQEIYIKEVTRRQ